MAAEIIQMGRTMPSFRIVLQMDKKENEKRFTMLQTRRMKEDFDEMMFDIPRLYISAYALILFSMSDFNCYVYSAL